MRLIAYGLVLTVLAFPCWGATIIVDQNGAGDFTNIQDALNSSWHNDIILVYPGTYNENISVSGVNILLTSEDPNDSNTVNATMITGSVSFQVGQKSTLTGFKLEGASITCYGASPVITKNIIENCDDDTMTEGGAIRGYAASAPEITYNIIRNNRIYLTINTVSVTAVGGAIANCNGLIAHNVIAGNIAVVDRSYAPYNKEQTAHTYGGGLYQCNGTIINNTIVGNVCSSKSGPVGTNKFSEALGAGLYNCNGIVVNNIIAFNQCKVSVSQLGYGVIDGGGIYRQCQNSYNCFWQNLPNDLAGGALAGEGDFGGNPRFAEDGNMGSYYQWIYGDYHLKSQAGRWDSNSLQWVNDSVTSYCIDMGDPCTPIGIEPNPNGARINMGVYGGTSQASKSPSGIVQPVCTESPAMDFNKDCKVDYRDFAIFVQSWLECNLDPPEACFQ
jgi:hypothetical protein